MLSIDSPGATTATRGETAPAPAVEEALLERLRAGDPRGLEDLIDQYAGRVYRLARTITGNDADAEEVTQDVFLSAVRKIGTFQGRARLWTWLYRIAANAALVKRRSRRAGREVSIEDLLPQFQEDGHRAGDRAMLLADWSETPEEELLSRESRAIVQRAIGLLPSPYQVVLALRDIEGLSTEEAADVLRESPACVKSRLHRARMALREEITRGLAPSGPGRRDPVGEPRR